MDDWFGKLVSNIEMDKFLLKENFASPETKNTYGILMSEDKDQILHLSMAGANMHFIERILIEYFQELKRLEVEFNVLAFDLGNSKVLSWVEINDDDEINEDKLIMAEAKVNAKFYEYDFHLSTTIVEKRDKIPVPDHYNTLK